jgi:hypothetical protein
LVHVNKLTGVDADHSQKLFDYGIRSSERLLQAAATKQGRQDLSEETGISEQLILKWVNLADLVRVTGIGEEYSALLEEAGVDTVMDLRKCQAEHLHESLLQTNEEKRIVRKNPSLNEVVGWIDEAKKLSPVVT